MKKITNFKNEKGITLLALVITIVVLLILSGVTIRALLSGDNGTMIDTAGKAKIREQFSNYKEALEKYKLEKTIELEDFDEITFSASKTGIYYDGIEAENSYTIKDVIPDIKDEYLDLFTVVKGELLLTSQDLTLLDVAKGLDIKINPYKIEEGTLLSSNANLALMDEDGVLTIPNTVTEIGEGAFSNVVGLKTVIIPGTCKKIGTSAFKYNSTIEKVIIQDGVEIIGDYAFQSCPNLREVSFSNTITSIGTYAFYSNSLITNMPLPDSLQTIGAYAFSYCKGLTEITIPANVKTMGSYSFYNCTNIVTVTINSTKLTKLDSYVLASCTSLQNAKIPPNVTSINALTFSGCKKLSNIDLTGNTKYIFSGGLLMATNGDSIVYIADDVIKNITTFEIPEGIKSFNVNISSYTNIKKLIIPASLTTLPNPAYLPAAIADVEIDANNNTYIVQDNTIYTKDMKKIMICFSKETEITIPEGIETLNQYAFRMATNAQIINTPTTLKTINQHVFNTCSKLQTLNINSGVTTINSLFKYNNYKGTVVVDANNPNFVIEDNVLYKISSNSKTLVTPLYKPTTFTIKSDVTSLDTYAFYYKSTLTEVIFENGCKTIGSNCFSGCSKLEKITLPQTLTTINSGAFGSCPIKEITIPDSVTTIGKNAFLGTSKINQYGIKIPGKNKGEIAGAPWGAQYGERSVLWKDTVID